MRLTEYRVEIYGDGKKSFLVDSSHYGERNSMGG